MQAPDPPGRPRQQYFRHCATTCGYTEGGKKSGRKTEKKKRALFFLSFSSERERCRRPDLCGGQLCALRLACAMAAAAGNRPTSTPLFIPFFFFLLRFIPFFFLLLSSSFFFYYFFLLSGHTRAVCLGPAGGLGGTHTCPCVGAMLPVALCSAETTGFEHFLLLLRSSVS